MFKSLAFVSLLAATTAVTAQSPASPSDPPATQQAPAPVVRSYQSQSTPAPQANAESQQGNQPDPSTGRAPMTRRSRRFETPSDQILDSQPISGVWLRSRSTAVLKTISATPHGAEIRLERGILNVNVHQPAIHSEILIDLPGGQTSLLKDGLYTFNADTNTVRVLHGEAAAYLVPMSTSGQVGKGSEKAIKIKEAHQLAFSPASASSPVAAGTSSTAGWTPTSTFRLQSVEAYPYELAADLLPAAPGDGSAYANVSGPGRYAYGGEDGPYYAGGWGYPYGYGYPYGFYPYGIGVGFGYGYYGGFHGYGGGYYGGRGFRR